MDPSETGPTARDTPRDMVWIPGGTFRMGSDVHYPEEAPAHEVSVEGFWIDRYQVTNAQFRRFIRETGYVTVAERIPDASDYPGASPADLAAGSVVFTQPDRPVPLDNHFRWWRWQAGASWQRPDGPGSTLHGKERHPVVHVAWKDICAYAEWIGKSIPTEAEWEFAARAADPGWEYAWGNELAPRGRPMANYWQGEFPWQNLGLDGFERTAPIGSFPPNQHGLFDMIGNAWEWTADWYLPHEASARSCCSASRANLQTQGREASVDPADVAAVPRKVLKGGSFACAENYCRRYRPAARMAHPIDTGTNHISFRCIIRP